VFSKGIKRGEAPLRNYLPSPLHKGRGIKGEGLVDDEKGKGGDLTMLEGNWASPEDFATLFQYFWHRDFPIDQIAVGAKRTDWTIHIGIAVRNIADLMGLVTRFERGGRKDAVLRSTEGDEIAIEWEWGGVWGNELEKLKHHNVWSKDKDSERLLKYAVLITYTHTPNIEKVYNHVIEKWEGAPCPLLLILIDLEESKKFLKEFKHIQMSVFHKGERRELRSAPAFPWKVYGTRWASELK
jgi:hypothetical protein